MTRLGFVTHWCSFAWFICFTLPFYAVASAMAAIYRYVTLMVVCLGYVVRVDVTLLPHSLQSMDPGYCASMAMLLLSHRHHNPVCHSFATVFAGKEAAQPPPPHASRARRNWELALTLARNPGLADY